MLDSLLPHKCLMFGGCRCLGNKYIRPALIRTALRRKRPNMVLFKMSVFSQFKVDCPAILFVGFSNPMIINSGQKDVDVFCVALVTYKLTII